MAEQQDNTEASGNKSDPGKKRNRKRRLLLAAGPITVAVISAYLYMTGGRYIETENAYIQADKVVISAEVTGPLAKVMVKENDLVEQGAPLFVIDKRPYLITLEQAQAKLQKVLSEIRVKKASYQQKRYEQALAQSNIDYAKKEYTRQLTLESSRAIAKSQLDDARHTFEVSQHRLDIIKSVLQQILAGLEGDPEIEAEQLADYRLAQAQVEQAALNLERTTVLAPFSGRVSKVPKPGMHIAKGAAVMSLMADSGFWIEANLKETELTHVRPGQEVEIVVDTYPDRTLSGRVQSISPGTGSEFSIIPAQNATGNWVKVVQRIAVRIEFDTPDQATALCSGMSSAVTIDTRYQRALPTVVQKGLSLVGFSVNAMANQSHNK